ncbi:PAS domain S-box protein [Methylobacterium tardum]|uniref:histidine kinase n=1 Tax=Methylobacterium tardum TaxID=374432 RepID=A0AA37TLL7_9HYPH|nr:PAS domain S-box protein [Methylobacterium tardum]GLS71731.1 hypothetical protein GCM10007890_37440 [Methylobacterium tardum]
MPNTFFAGGGQCGDRVRAYDWAATSLGPITAWPQSLRTTVGLVLLSHVPMALLWGGDGVMIYNDAYAVFAGDRHPQLLGSKVREGWPEVADFNDHVMRVGLAGETLSYKDQELTLYRHGRPEQVWMNLDSSPVLDESGRPAGVLCILADTTDRVAAEMQPDDESEIRDSEARFASDERLRAALDASDTGTFRWNIRTNALDWDEALDRLFGLTPGETARSLDQFIALVHPDDRAGVIARCEDCAASGADFEMAFRVVRPDGSLRWLYDRGKTFRDPDGTPSYMTGACVDITERREAEERLRTSEERLRLIIETATDYAILTMDPDRRITSWSAGAEATFGYTAEEIIGQLGDVLFTPEDRAAAVPQAEAGTAMTDGVAPDVRWHLRKDGSRVFIRGAARALRDGQARGIGLLKIGRDETERSTAEERLRASEEFNRRVLASSADCIKVLSLDGRLEFMSEGGLCVMEVDDFSAIEGACWLDFWQGDDHAKALTAVEAAKRGDTGRFQGAAPTLKGSPRWWDVVVTPIQGASGRPEKLLSVSRDITATARASEKLRASEAQLVHSNALLAAVMEAVPGVVYAKDLQGRMLAANRGTAELVGKSIAEILGRTDLEFLDDPVQAESVMANDRRIIERRQPEIVEETVTSPDGIPRVWLSTKAPFTDATGTVSGLVGTSVDITHRKLAEERLRALNETLEQQVEERTRDRDRMWRLSTDVMLVADFQARIEAVNPAWTTLFGWPEEELVGRSFMGLVHPDDVAATLAEVGRLSEGITTLRFENRYRAKDGSYRWLSWTAVPDARFIHAVGRDIQAEKEAAEALAATEEALRQSQKMEAVGQLTGGLAHDFNNLLTGISGSLELMQARMSQGRMTDLDRYMSAAQGAAKRAAALTHRLLAFSRRQTLDPKPTDVNALIHGMEDLIRRTVGPSVHIEVVGAGGLWPALVDPPQLENALLNLCINARDAMPDGGRITIETANRWLDDRAARERDLPPGQYLSLCVSDSGTGMTPDIIAKAFDPFFTTKPIGQGTGLGLSMIYGFARQSGGQVRIYSEVEQGTTVCLYLPRHHGDVGEAEAAPDLADAPRAEQGETVLIVDDEPSVRMLVTEVLEDLGYTAIEAADAQSGLKVLQSDVRVDLLVTDVGLPGGMNGRQMADAARVKRPDLKVLFITGYAENAAVGNGHLEPGMAVLTKPFVMETLASRIREMIEA